MTLSKNIAFYLFLSLVFISTLQFSFFEAEEISSISLVEEEQETFSALFEVQAIDAEETRFQFLLKYFCKNSIEKYSVIHKDKNYPAVYLPLPYSPPELI